VSRKRLLALLGAAAVAGCGGSHRTGYVRVDGPGYTFSAPAGWRVKRTPATVSATSGDRVVSVTVFQLARPFRAGVLAEARRELDRVVGQLAAKEHGRLTDSHDVPDGRRYAIALDGGKRVQEITFRLAGNHEYQLLCTRRRGDDGSVCARLALSFRPA
jgi:hypothetical protein